MEIFTRDKERKKAKCQLCSKELAFHSGTTNLREHLVSKRSREYKTDSKSETKKQETLFQTLTKPKCCSEARASYF